MNWENLLYLGIRDTCNFRQFDTIRYFAKYFLIGKLV